ncbi:MAG: hypothetical protein V7603_2308 [Micromonosporaceae bacterium]
MAVPAGQLLVAVVPLLTVAPLGAGAPPAPGRLSPAVPASALGARGTGIAFVLNFRVVRRRRIGFP